MSQEHVIRDESAMAMAHQSSSKEMKEFIDNKMINIQQNWLENELKSPAMPRSREREKDHGATATEQKFIMPD